MTGSTNWNLLETHPHWPAVLSVYERLKSEGHTAYLAGGCVRDLLLGVRSQDFDIATSADPDTVERLFPRSVAVGKAFGVMILPFEGFQIEVATFRNDGEYVDGRRPLSVQFSNAKEDALRRDFTVNAMFLDPLTREIHDFVNGQGDLELKKIRTVGDPHRRFEEDRLRVLRAVRFSAQLGFDIEENTYEEVRKFASRLGEISQERIRDELTKLLKSRDRVRGLAELEFTGLLPFVLPGLESHWGQSKLLAGLLGETVDEVALWAALILPGADLMGAAKAVQILRELKFSNSQVAQVQGVLSAFLSEERSKAQWRRILAKDFASSFLLVLKAMSLLNGSPIPEGEEAFKPEPLPSRFITSDDVKAAGIPPGPKMGQILEQAFDLQLEDQLKTREQALAWLKSR